MRNKNSIIDINNNQHVNTFVTKGRWYDDGWMSSKCEFLITPEIAVSEIHFRFWNPDFAVRYRDNIIKLKVDGQEFVSQTLQMDDFVEFRLKKDIAAFESIAVRVMSKVGCPPSKMDQREKSIRILDATLTAGK